MSIQERKTWKMLSSLDRMIKKKGQKIVVRIMVVNPYCETSGFLISKIVMFLRVNGYDVVFGHSDKCDIVLVNTCVVKNLEMTTTETLIKKSLQEATVKKVIVFGCFHAFIKKSSTSAGVVVVGPKELERFNTLFVHRIPIERVPAGNIDPRGYSADRAIRIEEDYFVLICQGCMQCCSYCNIKMAKGAVLSRSASEIIRDVQRGVREGKRDIVLVGDDCGSYGGDLKTDLAALIKEISDKCPEARFKIYSIFPGQLMRLFPALREIIADGKITVITVPIQSGSEKILKLMNRRYDMNRLKEVMEEIRSMAPSLFTVTHVIINFPTETREDFLCSLRAIPLFNDFEIVNYSNNPLTPASKLPEVEPSERERRLKICEEMIKQIGHGNLRRE